jgi:hypothetical protein
VEDHDPRVGEVADELDREARGAEPEERLDDPDLVALLELAPVAVGIEPRERRQVIAIEEKRDPRRSLTLPASRSPESLPDDSIVARGGRRIESPAA